MFAEHRAVAPLRVFLVLLFGILVMFQTFSLPGQFAHMAQESPDQAYLRWPMTAVSVFWLLCIQVVIVATWKLLTLVKNDRIFSDAALAWVDAIVWAIVAAWVVLLGVFLYVGFNASDPGLPLLLFLMLVGVAVLGLLMVVMRALLRQATTLRTDMEAVI
ncbi:fatty acid desaturase [Micromonospora sp. A200]|nr:fatty acid desaturase [Micromonospora sp. A200]